MLQVQKLHQAGPSTRVPAWFLYGATDAQAAYNNLMPAALPGGIDPGFGQLGGLTLYSGIHKVSGGSYQITGSGSHARRPGRRSCGLDLTNGVVTYRGGQGVPRCILKNGALPKNVFLQVGSSVAIDEAGGGSMVGTKTVHSGVTFSAAGNATITTLDGRAPGACMLRLVW